ncbi:MAG: class I SAM-dependent methyltransferase [Alphaproteobacteria bacterium]
MTSKPLYDNDAKNYCRQYESLKFEDIHQDILAIIPPKGTKILDVGAGSGRDAAWFAVNGYEVTALEPSLAMIREGKSYHKNSAVRWICDSLPELKQVQKLGQQFDFILLSAVWMHVKPEERPRAFKNLNSLLAPNGQLSIVLRFGSLRDDMYLVSFDELKSLAEKYKLETTMIKERGEKDKLNRFDVEWGRVCFRKSGLNKQ